MVQSMHREMDLRQIEIADEAIESIYFGGGTPSILPAHQIGQFIEHIHRISPITVDAEITLEANPDDLTIAKLKQWKADGINRLSIGVQSFWDDDLQFLKRTHRADHIIRGIKTAQDIGFNNLTIDLIYGLPQMDLNRWEKNLQTFFDLQIDHLSSYALTLEEKTELHHLVKTGAIQIPSDEILEKQFDLLQTYCQTNAFEAYEISNYARNKKYAKHNTSYWQHKKYIGIGPSAHSYQLTSRRWNISNNAAYIRGVENGSKYWEEEQLSIANQFNESIMTGLRTMWGCQEKTCIQLIGETRWNKAKRGFQKHMDAGNIEYSNGRFLLRPKARFFADGIASDLFID